MREDEGNDRLRLSVYYALQRKEDGHDEKTVGSMRSAGRRERGKIGRFFKGIEPSILSPSDGRFISLYSWRYYRWKTVSPFFLPSAVHFKEKSHSFALLSIPFPFLLILASVIQIVIHFWCTERVQLGLIVVEMSEFR